jgi:hypothetical protein
LKAKHSETWKHWSKTFVRLRGAGYPLKRIMRLFRSGNGYLLFSWTVIERAIKRTVEIGELPYVAPVKKTVLLWEPQTLDLQRTTLWDFPRRGDWAVHLGDYRGNWPPQIPRNLICRYTREGDLVVDAFVGGGTTLIESWLLGRHSIGLDISLMSVQTVGARLCDMERHAKEDNKIKLNPDHRPLMVRASALKLCDVLELHGGQVGNVSLVCAHPPYLDALRYTIDNPDDLSLISSPTKFYAEMAIFARAARQVLVPGGVLAVLIGDVRKNKKTVPLGLGTLNTFLTEGFEVEEIVVKSQHRDRSSEFYFKRHGDHLRFAHEYLFILRKSDDSQA